MTPNELRKLLSKHLEDYVEDVGGLWVADDAWEADKQTALTAYNAVWHENQELKAKLAASEQARQRAEEAVRKALQHLDVSICDCGFHLKETDAADVLRAALAQTKDKTKGETT